MSSTPSTNYDAWRPFNEKTLDRFLSRLEDLRESKNWDSEVLRPPDAVFDRMEKIGRALDVLGVPLTVMFPTTDRALELEWHLGLWIPHLEVYESKCVFWDLSFDDADPFVLPDDRDPEPWTLEQVLERLPPIFKERLAHQERIAPEWPEGCL